MDRFSEETAADLARSSALVSPWYRNEDGFPDVQTETCPTCDPQFTLDKGTELPTIKCANPNCLVVLYPCCPQFECAGCGQTFCLEHAIEEEQDFECTCQRVDVDVNDASWCFEHNPSIRPRPAKFCAACLEEAEASDWGGEEIDKLEPVSIGVPVPNIPEFADAGRIA